jgi:hypothetical protein
MCDAKCVDELYRERIETLAALKGYDFSDSTEKADALALLKAALNCPQPLHESHIESSLTKIKFRGDTEMLAFDEEMESVWVKSFAVGDNDSLGKRSTTKSSFSVKYSELMITLQGEKLMGFENTSLMSCLSGDCVQVVKDGVSGRTSEAALTGCDTETAKNVRDAVNYLIISNRLGKP